MKHEPIDRAAYERGLAALLASRAEMIATIPARIVERYGVLWCKQCDLAVQYCRCGPASTSEAKDGGETDLARRVREARERFGGR